MTCKESRSSQVVWPFALNPTTVSALDLLFSGSSKTLVFVEKHNKATMFPIGHAKQSPFCTEQLRLLIFDILFWLEYRQIAHDVSIENKQ